MMDNETYIKLQHRHVPSLELVKSLSDIRSPPTRQLMQKFPLFEFEKTFKGSDRPFFEEQTIERKLFKNIYGRQINWSYSHLSHKINGIYDELAFKIK